MQKPLTPYLLERVVENTVSEWEGERYEMW